MRIEAIRRACALLLVFCAIAAPAAAQRISIAFSSGSGTTGTISTAGADCTTATNCVSFSTDDVASFGVDLDVGVSGTFQFEILVDPESNRWRAWPDSAGAR